MLAVATGLAACKDESGSDVFGGGSNDGGLTSADAGEDQGATGGESVGDGDADGDGDGPRFDVADDGGVSGGDDGGSSAGCKAVDFLFVIDNSGSMGEEQSALIASFPGFIDAIDATLDVQQDYHLMVTDTDAWQFEGCPIFCAFPFPPLPGIPLPCQTDYDCMNPPAPAECEDVLGAGITWPKGAGSSSQDCMFSSGARYIDATEPDVKSAFQCAAQVGVDSTANAAEAPMEAMVAAVSSSGAAAACNEGFLRDDAILVVTFVTDENDDAGDGSAGTPEGWKAALAAAKNNDENAIVVLGLFGDGTCSAAEAAPRLDQFVSLFGPRGFKGNICAPSYESFFLDAISTIDTVCDEFIPPAG